MMWVCFCEYVEGSGIVIWEFRIFGVWGLEYCLKRAGLAPTAEEGDVMRLGICIYNVTIFEQENGKRVISALVLKLRIATVSSQTLPLPHSHRRFR